MHVSKIVCAALLPGSTSLARSGYHRLMTVELAFEKKHERRVLPTRSLGNAPAPAPRVGAREELWRRCREVVAECGPSPYLYAKKHHPPAMEIMGAVERALWPSAT